MNSTERAWADKSFYQPSESSTSSLDKRADEDTVFRAVWDKTFDFWIIGKLKVKSGQYISTLGAIEPGKKVLGKGGQGEVTEGFWYTGTSEDFNNGCFGAPMEAAVKTSPRPQEYRATVSTVRVKSPYVVETFLYGMARTTTIVNDKPHVWNASIIAHERLKTNVQAALDRKQKVALKPLYKAVILGALAAEAVGIYNMDLKLENIMSKTESTGEDGQFKIIDWGMIRDGDPDKMHTGWMGTYGHMAPEMLKRKLIKEKKIPNDGHPGWKSGPAMVFTIGMVVLNTQHNTFEGTPTKAMRTYAKAIFGEDHTLPDHSHYWNWVYFVQAYLDEEELHFPLWGFWFSRALGPPEHRYTLQQAWDALVDAGFVTNEEKY